MIDKPHHKAWLEANPHRSAEWLKDRLRDGFHVHHIDCDHENNDPDNLLLLDGVDHMRLHALPIGRELKRLARARLVYAAATNPRETEGWRVGAVCYALRQNGWGGYAISKVIAYCRGDQHLMSEPSVNMAAKKFAKQEGLEWPVNTPICLTCSSALAGRKRYSHRELGSGLQPFLSGGLPRRSMLLPICDLLAELGIRPANCTRGYTQTGKFKNACERPAKGA